MGSPIKSVVILGGGTAGWMTAASLSNLFKKEALKITLVESSDIGTVGVGEATVPAIRDYFQSLGLKTEDVMRATQGTVKLGIEFDGWSRPGHAFFHPFGLYGVKAGNTPFHLLWLKLREMGDHSQLADYNLGTQLAYLNKFTPPRLHARGDFDVYDWAIHFDAGLFARFLRDFSQSRGVTRIDAKLVTADLGSHNGFIERLHLSNGEAVEADLFIDCSGMRSLLLRGALKTPFVDWRHWLSCDRAVAAPCENRSGLQPYTRSSAKTAGWMWRIPLSHRVGNGYVYNSEFISEDEAAATLLTTVEGPLLGPLNHIGFRTGHASQFWQKNCIGIGLSAGFLEPLESTSIALIQSGIEKLIALFPDKNFETALSREYNRSTTLEFERIRDFIILHYHANQRGDDRFWARCRQMELPETLSHKIDLFKSHGHFVRHEWESFFDASWLSLYAGFGWLPKPNDLALARVDLEYVKSILPRLRQDIHHLASSAPSHSAFLEGLDTAK